MADVAIFIGRFQPVHIGHIAVAERALKRHKRLFICIGSSNQPRRTKNPFTFEERVSLWEASLPANSHVEFIDLDDMTYSDNEWVSQVRHRVNDRIRSLGLEPEDTSVALTGHNKDRSSYYLRFFPEWESDLLTEGYDTYASTRIREFFYGRYVNNMDRTLTQDMFYGHEGIRGLPHNSLIWQPHYQSVLRDLAPEWDFDQGYDPKKFHVNVLTVDAVVVQNGHVLTVRRKNRPGKGLMALPGGHINEYEKLQDAMLRELREETGIDLSDRVLRANIVSSQVFDDPDRSSRARVITQAYLIKLTDEEKLVKVRGGDDAASAFWTPLSEVRAAEWFEDHAFIVQKMTAGL